MVYGHSPPGDMKPERRNLEPEPRGSMTAVGQPMDRDISCANVSALIEYVSATLGSDAVDSLLSGLVHNEAFLIEDKYEPGRIEPVAASHLLDSDYWVSNEFSLRLFENASKVLPGPRPLYRAGREVVLHQASFRRLSAVARLLPAHLFLARVPKENTKYNRTKTVTIKHRGRGHAIFELRYRPDVRVTRDVCEWNLGIYSGYGLITGAENIRVTETSCVTEGAPVCTFEAVWTRSALSKGIQGFLLYLFGRDFFEAYERERLDKEDLVFNLEQKVGERTKALRRSEERYRSLAANLEKMVETRTEALRDSEERYRTLIENSEDVILVVQNREIAFANSRVVKLLGRARNEIMDQTLDELVFPEDMECVNRLYAEIEAATELQYPCDFRVIHKTDGFRWAEMNAVQCDWEGNPAILCFLRDVTKRKDLEEKVRESEALYRSLVERSGDIIIQWDVHRILTFVNPSGVSFLGKETGELIGHCLDEYVVREDVRRTRRQINTLFHGKDFVSFENRLVNGTGEIRHVSWTMNPVKGIDENVIGVQAVARDVTEAKKREEQAIQMEKLRALGEMAGGVAHDFNNMLAAILGRAQLLKLYLERMMSDQGTQPDPQIRTGLDMIERAASDAAETVRRIQEFTKVASQKDFVVVNLNEVVGDVVELTRPRWKDQAESKGVTIGITKRLGDISPVLGNPAELREVLINLVVNAVDAVPSGGDIVIETGMEGESGWVSVTDTGGGMSAKSQRRVFDPFFTTKGPQSSGLGLSVSYGIVKRHRGEILIKSRPKKGATFTVLLPVAQGESSTEQELPERESVRPASILVVDDEEAIRNNLSEILTLEGHRVVLASGGEEGIEMFKNGDFDLVFTDLGMPEVSGWQLAKAVKELNPGTPVAIITGWGANLDRKKMRESGISFQISKPFRINQLLGIVAEGLALRERK
jgi:PAS domain S-box-containing protein